uniref:Acyl-CoA thioesterase 6 n=1 Tax=Crocodylus porosus TaxID=8502 RepID=A0A7M4G2Z8_CROPO
MWVPALRLLRRVGACAPCRRSSAMGAPRVRLVPDGRSLWDEPLGLAVQGLGPRQEVTLRAALQDEAGEDFEACGRYRADGRGELELGRAPALLGGSFSGLEPMGLLWALRPRRPFWRLLKRDVRSPFRLRLDVLEGHGPLPGRLLARAEHERCFLGPGVVRLPLRHGRLRATLFLPPGDGPFPGIIDLYGTGGGLPEYRACLLANHGFATLALAYYNYEDLPKEMTEFHLEYFEEAVNYMLEHPQVKGPGVGLLGISKGGDGPFPGVIDMFGDEGGLTEYRASLLANHGFAALSLPYFDFEDLPRVMKDLNFEYFEEAARFLQRHPKLPLLQISGGSGMQPTPQPRPGKLRTTNRPVWVLAPQLVLPPCCQEEGEYVRTGDVPRGKSQVHVVGTATSPSTSLCALMRTALWSCETHSKVGTAGKRRSGLTSCPACWVPAL